MYIYIYVCIHKCVLVADLVRFRYSCIFTNVLQLLRSFGMQMCGIKFIVWSYLQPGACPIRAYPIADRCQRATCAVVLTWAASFEMQSL